MKNGKRPTNAQKAILAQAGKDPAEWLVTKHLECEMHIVNKSTGNQTIIVL